MKKFMIFLLFVPALWAGQRPNEFGDIEWNTRPITEQDLLALEKLSESAIFGLDGCSEELIAEHDNDEESLLKSTMFGRGNIVRPPGWALPTNAPDVPMRKGFNPEETSTHVGRALPLAVAQLIREESPQISSPRHSLSSLSSDDGYHNDLEDDDLEDVTDQYPNGLGGDGSFQPHPEHPEIFIRVEEPKPLFNPMERSMVSLADSTVLTQPQEHEVPLSNSEHLTPPPPLLVGPGIMLRRGVISKVPPRRVGAGVVLVNGIMVQKVKPVADAVGPVVVENNDTALDLGVAAHALTALHDDNDSQNVESPDGFRGNPDFGFQSPTPSSETMSPHQDQLLSPPVTQLEFREGSSPVVQPGSTKIMFANNQVLHTDAATIGAGVPAAGASSASMSAATPTQRPQAVAEVLIVDTTPPAKPQPKKGVVAKFLSAFKKGNN